MKLNDIQFIFNRALSLTFNKKKLLFVFVLLALCGLVVVFFHALSLQAGHWMRISLSFLPFFLCAAVLLAMGIILVRIYHNEIKQKSLDYRKIVFNSCELVASSSYFSVPIILCYLLLWMMLGIFLLLKSLPGIGEFFAVLLSFAPFLINLGSLVLVLANVALLFFLTPAIALNGLNRIRLSQIMRKRMTGDLFSGLLLGFIAILPLLLIFGLLLMAWALTGSVCPVCKETSFVILQWFIMMIPFAAVLAPAVVFFFNFAAEAHVLLQKPDQNGNLIR